MAVSYADPEVLNRIRRCLRKQGYNTEERAWEVAKKVYRRHGDLIGPFKCGYCPKWHCGHPRNPTLQARLCQLARSW